MKDEKAKKNRPTWSPYYERITRDKTKYTRKRKHKEKGWDNG